MKSNTYQVHIVETDNYVTFISPVDRDGVAGVPFDAMGDDDKSGENGGGVARPPDLNCGVTLASMAVLVIVAGSVGTKIAI